jgi:hypothetical protein
MKTVFTLTRIWLLAAAVLCAAGVHAAGQFAADVQALTRTPHRLLGSKEMTQAAGYMAERFRAIGVDTVVEQQFPVMTPEVKRCTVTVGKRALPLLPMRPNGIMLPVTPEGGLSGQLLDAGDGSLAAYGTRKPQGKIVVLDYNSTTAWLRAFRLGASAVIFVGKGTAESWQTHFTESNANMPRFYFAGPRAALTDGSVARIDSEVLWKSAASRNVIAFIKGTKPKYTLDQPETTVIAATLDTWGEVPHLTRGARGAANCAGLLALAQYYVQHRPARNIALVAFGGDTVGHLASSVFYRTLENDAPNVKLENRIKFREIELQSIAKMDKALNNIAALKNADRDTKRILVQRLGDKGAEHVYILTGRIADMNLLGAVPSRHPREEDAAYQARVDASKRMKAKFAEPLKKLTAEKMSWNDLRKALAEGRLDDANSGETAVRLQTVVDEVQTDIAKRKAQLAALEKELNSAKAVKTLLGDTFINLHLALTLGDTTPHWGLIIGGDSAFHATNDNPGLYGKIQGTFKDAAQTVAVPNFEITTADGTMTTRLFWAASLAHSGEIAGRVGVYNLCIGTVQEKLPREGTPDDTTARLNLARIEAQVNEFAALFAAAGASDGLSLRRTIVADKNYNYPETKADGKITGTTVMGISPGSSVPNRPTSDAVIELFVRPLTNMDYRTNKIPGFNATQILFSDANANYAYGPVPVDNYHSILVGFAATFDARGQVKEVTNNADARAVYARLNIFPCAEQTETEDAVKTVLYAGSLVTPPQVELADTTVMWAQANSPIDPGTTFSATTDGIVYWYTDKRIKSVKLFGSKGKSAVALFKDAREAHAEDNDPEGGLAPLPGGLFFPSTSLLSAGDLWRLNENRLSILREKGITNSSIEELHGRAQDLIDAARDADTTAQSEALAASAFMAERPVYQTVRTSLDDLVRAVLILLALAIPFAFALERLLIGSTNIYRQIGWFVGFFIVTFLLLYMVHPAFKISTQPIIIFLAFALVMLSSLVIVVIVQKFETELKVLQGLSSSVHTADVSRFSTMMAAMGMGISTMRRRPLRTALTALTITLLTFTILNFASFDTRIDVVKLPGGTPPKYTGVVMHKVNWTSLNNELETIIASRWGEASDVTTRYWLPADVTPGDGPLITCADGTNPKALKGILGIDPAEITHRADLRGLLTDGGKTLTQGVYMTQAMAGSLKVEPGQQVIVGGLTLTVAGILDAATVTGIKDMDDNGILPVDFAAMTSSSQGAQQDPAKMAAGSDVLAAAQNKQDWVPLPTDQVVIVSSDTARLLGASLRVVTLYTKDAQSAATIAEDASRLLPLPITGTRPEGVYTHVLAPTVMAKGVKDLIFPIILGGLVIFGTMLGSVADREKEIYTFSALGLAPAHVATLFFAEALVYSFIGGLGGYLLAQGVQKLLALLVSIGALSTMPEMNYSSINAIMTIIIVMGTVMVSAIYPAFKASRSANPGILRSWKQPAPDGDEFHIVFPFTVSQYDITGVMSFLKEHFDNFTDTSLGVFMARDTRVLRLPDGALGLESLLALAPFDLGVTQDFTLTSAPSEIDGIDEVKIEIRRRSGQHKDWTRLNKVLLDDLRKQFLLWRALPGETMELYRRRTLITLGEVAEEMTDITAPTAPRPVA